MILSKEDYTEYYETDIKATGLENNLITRIRDKRIKFYKMLRKTEYYTNCRHDFFGKIFGKILRFRYFKLCERNMWTIPINVFGKGLQIVHAGPIVVTGSAVIGDYARVHVGVNIGNALARGEDGSPVIGKCCYFGPGAKIFGPIVIGDDVAIGANAVVNSSFPEGKCSIAGVPAKKISDNGSDKYIKI